MNVNSIGNAGEQVLVARQSHKRAAETSFQDELKKQPLSSTPAENEGEPALTTSEKQYFEQLFPNAVDEVRMYNPYQREGATTSVRLGTLIDRKG
jgi:hypothetical protein